MIVVIPEDRLPARLLLDKCLDDDEFWHLCAANPEVRFERTSKGDLIIVPPPTTKSDFLSIEIAGALTKWAQQDERGRAFGASASFRLPSGATYGPDAAWATCEKLDPLEAHEKRFFVHICPDFVVEIAMPSDPLGAKQRKMREWIAEGVELGWLMDVDKQEIYIYRAGQSEPERRAGVEKLAGERPIAGFELDLARIWEGL